MFAKCLPRALLLYRGCVVKSICIYIYIIYINVVVKWIGTVSSLLILPRDPKVALSKYQVSGSRLQLLQLQGT